MIVPAIISPHPYTKMFVSRFARLANRDQRCVRQFTKLRPTLHEAKTVEIPRPPISAHSKTAEGEEEKGLITVSRSSVLELNVPTRVFGSILVLCSA
jgi:hypothetical protein